MLWWHQQHPPSPGYLGYVEGEFVRVASPIAGALIDLPIKRGMDIAVGESLFVLEHENEVAARDEATRRYERAKFELNNLKTGKRPEEIEVIEETLAQAEADQEFAHLFFERQKKLIITNATSTESVDRAKAAYERGQARIAELKSQVKVARLPARKMEIKAAEKEVEAAHAVVKQAQWRLEQKFIKSLVKGLVFDTLYVPGEWVPAGSPVVVILPPENIKVRFFVPEYRLGRFKVGQHVTLKCHGQEKEIPAILSYISPTAEYTPPVIYSREWRSKLMYMLEARPIQNPEVLHPGQPVDVTVGTP
jgi:HlyD family secretion protein